MEIDLQNKYVIIDSNNKKSDHKKKHEILAIATEDAMIFKTNKKNQVDGEVLMKVFFANLKTFGDFISSSKTITDDDIEGSPLINRVMVAYYSYLKAMSEAEGR